MLFVYHGNLKRVKKVSSKGECPICYIEILCKCLKIFIQKMQTVSFMK